MPGRGRRRWGTLAALVPLLAWGLAPATSDAPTGTGPVPQAPPEAVVATLDPAALLAEVSPQVEEIILHAMERDPKNRYQTAASMKAELDDPRAVQVTGRSERLHAPTAWRRNWKKALWVALGILVPLIIFGLVVWLIIHRGPSH